MQADYPQIVAATQVLPEDIPTRVGDLYNTELGAMVDPDFFRVLAVAVGGGETRAPPYRKLTES